MERKPTVTRDARLRKALLVALGVSWLWAGPARAADYKTGPNAFAGHVGGQAGLGYAPTGFKMFFEYGRHLSGKLWLDIETNLVFGDRWIDEDCWWDERNDRWHCNYWHGRGFEFQVFGGVKWKFHPIKAPFVPYAKVGGVLYLLSYPGRPDDVIGGGLGVRGGGGFKYYFIKNFGAGVETNLAVGFAGLSHGIGFYYYLAFDIGFGVEVLF